MSMSKHASMIMIATLLLGSTSAALSKPSGDPFESGAQTSVQGVQVAQFNSAPAQSSARADDRLESFGGY